jgi:osmotically-inducible protein OsmY
MIQAKRLALKLVFAGASAVVLATLNGCVPLIATGVGATALVADDRRTTGIMVEDESIENKTLLRIEQKHGSRAHVNVTSYNRIVLLTGEATTPEIRADIEAIARGVENVRNVQNEITVAQNTTLMLRSNDTVLTSKIKARFVDANKFRANHVKVVTENSVVYLLGLVKRQEAQDATDIASRTGGVHRVVRVFEYTD